MSNTNKNKVVLQRIEEAISRIENKESEFFFFVPDSRNNPSGGLCYLYDMAKTINNMGHKVTMLYQTPNEYTQEELDELTTQGKPYDTNRVFIGVRDWLGDSYADLPHLNIAKEEWKVSPGDFLFIPEAFSSLMFETFKNNIPCKRYVVLQNFNYLTEFIPLGVEWANYGIADVITSSEVQANRVKSVFPYVRTTIIPPGIPSYFRKPVLPKKLVVSVIASSKSDVNRMIKTFYWKYPKFKFITFDDLRGYPRDSYAERLKESAITLWVDDKTSFGYGALEAMKCGNIVIGKLTEDVQDWMKRENKLADNIIWFQNLDDVPKILNSVLISWMLDEVPAEIVNAIEETNKMHTEEEWVKNVTNFVEGIKAERIREFKGAESVAKAKISEEKNREKK